MYDPAIRKLGEDFLQYLHDSNQFQISWERCDLAILYQDFRRMRVGRRRCFSEVLFHMARYAPKLLRVRGGTRVIFADGEGKITDARIFHDLANAVRQLRIERHREETLALNLENLLEPHHENVYVSLQPESHVSEGPTSHYNCNVYEGLDDEPVAKICVVNNSDDDVILSTVTIMKDPSLYQLLSEYNLANGITLLPRDSIAITVKALLQNGVCTTRISFAFERPGKHQFSLLRVLEFNVSKSSIDELLAPTSPYQYAQYKPAREHTETILGEKPPRVSYKLEKERPLSDCKVPLSVKLAVGRKAFQENQTPSHRNDIVLHDLLKAPLSIDDYSRKFQLLLHIEELQIQDDIKRYDMVATMTKEKHDNLLYLRVPGLAEKRPSVLRGDRVYVSKIDADRNEYGPNFEGYVHKVELNFVGIKFGASLMASFVKNMEFYIRFTVGRFPLKLMHRAISLINEHRLAKAMLFTADPPPPNMPQRTLRMQNRNLDGNQQQQDAVHNIVLGETSPIYIIYGPPGTGKTVTMVEAIVQTIAQNDGAHVMVCAPSNSACDLLTERLRNFRIDDKDILRMHAASRSWGDVRQNVKAVSNYNGDFHFQPKAVLQNYRVIVCTVITAGRIASAKFPPKHFSRVFIDEAGQAMEPECLVALAGILAENGKVVLAGDPKQLGPIIRSPVAKTNGLQVSLLERLMDSSPIYQRPGENMPYNPQCVTKLLKNYRSHESIIKVSNERFYDNELEVCADPFIRNAFLGWGELPSKKIPLIFEGVQGKDEREETSPSFFNVQEVKAVKKYVNKVLEYRGMKVKPTDIGIITPYRKQVQKIRKVIKEPAIKVGSVEEFQGQERLVIIISTVRSNTEHFKIDAKFNLGFLRNPKRFNVAVTRAKALLIIVGNPRILSMDENWAAFLRHCITCNAYSKAGGVAFGLQDMTSDLTTLTNLLEELGIAEEIVSNPDQADPRYFNDGI